MIIDWRLYLVYSDAFDDTRQQIIILLGQVKHCTFNFTPVISALSSILLLLLRQYSALLFHVSQTVLLVVQLTCSASTASSSCLSCSSCSFTSVADHHQLNYFNRELSTHHVNTVEVGLCWSSTGSVSCRGVSLLAHAATLRILLVVAGLGLQVHGCLGKVIQCNCTTIG